MEQKYILGLVALSLVAILGIGIVSAHGFGMWKPDLSDEEKSEIQEQRETMQTAIADGDYETWKSLMEDRIAKMQEQITEGDFNKIVERHQESENMREAMKESREQFCEEHDCPDIKDEDQRFKGHFGHRMMPGFQKPFAESDSE